MQRDVTPARLRRAAQLGRSHGITAGTLAASRSVGGARTILSAAVSLGVLAVGVGTLSVAGALLLAAVSTMLMMVCAGPCMLALLLGVSPLDVLLLALPLLVLLGLIRRGCLHRLSPTRRGPLPR
jgi:hypothetical protein